MRSPNSLSKILYARFSYLAYPTSALIHILGYSLSVGQDSKIPLKLLTIHII
ncbi:hypothetical protein [Helicobacter cinaedi]|uniref:hypothetical protein n=1 Tax=Helicobacter cinaedi TaxID=213 RepID=UPI0015F07673|nr:hypothetical protein [Helicobacter cinaedi]